MATAQYWRIRGARPYGSDDLELSGLQLWGAGARLDAAATITSTIPPSAGALTSLSDSNLTTVVSWTRDLYQAGGFSVKWVFSAAVSVDSIRSGSGASQAVSLQQLDLDWSTDGTTWQPASGAPMGPVPYTGPNTVTAFTEVKFRFWSLYVTKWMSNGVENGGGQVRVAEWQLFAMGEPVLSAPLTSSTTPTPYVASASSSLGGGYEAFRAFDGNLSDANRWISQSAFAGPERLTLDLGSSTPVTTIKIAPDGAVNIGGGYYITEFQLQASDTGLFAGEQTVVRSWTGLPQSTWASSTFTTFEVAAGGSLPVTAEGFGTISRARNFETGGNGYISGTVKVLGDPTNVPTRRRVRLLRDRDALLVAETWSDAVTGAYLFNEIDRTATYTVLTDDYEHSYRSVVADRITPSLMS